jgi:hypothetical protein
MTGHTCPSPERSEVELCGPLERGVRIVEAGTRGRPSLGSLSWASKKGSKHGGVGRSASRGTAQIAQGIFPLTKVLITYYSDLIPIDHIEMWSPIFFKRGERCFAVKTDIMD